MAETHKAFSTESSLKGPRAVELLDEAVAVYRHTPLALFLIYYMGALPFCLALIYFYFDMTQNVDADAHLPSQALLLTVLYFWMKTCQAVFARRVLAVLEGGDAEPWSLRRWFNTAVLQTIFAGSFVIVYPMAIFITLPFGWVSAFYHNISIVGTGTTGTIRASLNEAMDLSKLWPKQNHLIIGIEILAALILFVNLGVFFSMIPELLNVFTGISTAFNENGSAWSNSSFYLDVLVFCFLVLNPFNKVVYVLRCFYGRARLTGADLKAELQRQDRLRREQMPWRGLAAAIVFAGVLLLMPARADDAVPTGGSTPVVMPAVSPDSSPVSAGVPASPVPEAVPPPPPPAPSVVTSASATSHLNQSIEETLKKTDFAWRLPRVKSAEDGNEDWMERIYRLLSRYLAHSVEKIGKFLHKALHPFSKFLKWLFGLDKTHDVSQKDLSGVTELPWRLIFFAVLVLIVGVLLYILVRHFRAKGLRPLEQAIIAPVKTVDLEAEDVRADELPEDSWLALARQLIERGEQRLALRALYLATLSMLAHGQYVRLNAGKSNRDYLLELTRRMRGVPEAVRIFRSNVDLFEASWYGTHAVTSAIIDTMLANHQQMRGYATV